MSNCVKIVEKNLLELNSDIFDLEKLKKDINETPEQYDDIDIKDYHHRFIWWFVKFNTVFVEKADQKIIAFLLIGGGKSEHTWRDLKGLFEYLGELLLDKESCRGCKLIMQDEYDGFKETFHCEFKFGKND